MNERVVAMADNGFPMIVEFIPAGIVQPNETWRTGVVGSRVVVIEPNLHIVAAVPHPPGGRELRLTVAEWHRRGLTDLELGAVREFLVRMRGEQ